MIPTHSLLGRQFCRIRGLYWKALIVSCGGRCGGGLMVGPHVVWKHMPHAGVEIGTGVVLGSGCIIDAPRGGRLVLADGVKLNAHVYLGCVQSIIIGARTLIAEFVSIRDADHGIAAGMPIASQPLTAAPVVIGDDVWIGRGVAVLRGSVLGNGVVVGANAVVKGELLANSVYVGVPVRKVTERT